MHEILIQFGTVDFAIIVFFRELYTAISDCRAEAVDIPQGQRDDAAPQMVSERE